MQIDTSSYQYRSVISSSTKESVEPFGLVISDTFDEAVSSAPSSISPAQNSLSASLTATELRNASMQDPEIVSRGAKGETLEEASSKGTINPADWLSKSDVKLFEQTTGGTIVDGVIYDKDGNESTSKTDMDLVCALYQMRNFGTFDSQGNRVALTGEITAENFRGFIEHFESNTGAFDMKTLEKAYDLLASSEASKSQ